MASNKQWNSAIGWKLSKEWDTIEISSDSVGDESYDSYEHIMKYFNNWKKRRPKDYIG